MARFENLDSGSRPERVHWETREITMPRSVTRQEARTLLTSYAEVGQWELARLRVFSDGRRWALLRRRAMSIPRNGPPRI